MTEDSTDHEPAVQESPSDAEDEYLWPRLLGEIDRRVNGREYVGHFTGVGRITGDYDEGSFLSDMSFKERHRSWRKLWKDHRLEMEQLIPEDWREAKVEYEITVRARRLTPRPSPKPLSNPYT
jgi:hypothetical protein